MFYVGEVALPGGKADEGDKDDADTAKREAEEEIGLDPKLVNVVTVLEPFLSKVSLLFNPSITELKLLVFRYLWKLSWFAWGLMCDRMFSTFVYLGILV